MLNDDLQLHGRTLNPSIWTELGRAESGRSPCVPDLRIRASADTNPNLARYHGRLGRFPHIASSAHARLDPAWIGKSKCPGFPQMIQAAGSSLSAHMIVEYRRCICTNSLGRRSPHGRNARVIRPRYICGHQLSDSSRHPCLGRQRASADPAGFCGYTFPADRFRAFPNSTGNALTHPYTLSRVPGLCTCGSAGGPCAPRRPGASSPQFAELSSTVVAWRKLTTPNHGIVWVVTIGI